MTEPTENQSGFWRLLSNPRVAASLSIAGVVIGVVSIAVGVYAYAQTNRTRELIYSVNPARAVVVNARQSSQLTVAFDGQPVKSDITAAQIAFWNNGNESIKKSNILKPLVLTTGSGARILEATIRKVSRDVTGITLDQSALSSGRVTVNWDILEQNDGAVIQLIYAADTTTPITATAVIEGQGETVNSTIQGSESEVPFGFVGKQILSLLTLLIYFAIVWMFYLLASRGAMPSGSRGRVLFFVMGLSAVFIYIFIYVLIPQTPSPPFGF